MDLLTSESVTPGHPDKVCDQISDAILDAYLSVDPTARVAVEALASARGIVLAGEVRSAKTVSPESIARDVIRQIGYTAESGLDPDNLIVANHLTEQSPQIGTAVDGRVLGAGDQGMMFGYATRETDALMPAPLMTARAITERLVTYREDGILPWLRPDGKAQVTVRYENGAPQGVVAVVISTQHHPDIDVEDVRAELQKLAYEAADSIGLRMEDGVALHLNPAGAWTFGGPAADAGLTGRKIIVDTYGGASRHGGGAFSGKDPSKVDRSGAYAARQAARHVVESGWADRAEVQLSYAIGVPEPVSISVETFGTGREPGEQIADVLADIFDFTPRGIIDRLGLEQPIYLDTARSGHFGRATLPWEALVAVEQ